MVAVISCYEGPGMVTTMLDDVWNVTGTFLAGKIVLEKLKVCHRIQEALVR